MKGTIKHMLVGKSFGFIRAEDGIEYFFHRDDTVEFDELLTDYMYDKHPKVEFIAMTKSPKGPRASDVVRLI